MEQVRPLSLDADLGQSESSFCVCVFVSVCVDMWSTLQLFSSVTAIQLCGPSSCWAVTLVVCCRTTASCIELRVRVYGGGGDPPPPPHPPYKATLVMMPIQYNQPLITTHHTTLVATLVTTLVLYTATDIHPSYNTGSHTGNHTCSIYSY